VPRAAVPTWTMQLLNMMPLEISPDLVAIGIIFNSRIVQVGAAAFGTACHINIAGKIDGQSACSVGAVSWPIIPSDPDLVSIGIIFNGRIVHSSAGSFRRAGDIDVAKAVYSNRRGLIVLSISTIVGGPPLQLAGSVIFQRDIIFVGIVFLSIAG